MTEVLSSELELGKRDSASKKPSPPSLRFRRSLKGYNTKDAASLLYPIATLRTAFKTNASPFLQKPSPPPSVFSSLITLSAPSSKSKGSSRTTSPKLSTSPSSSASSSSSSTSSSSSSSSSTTSSTSPSKPLLISHSPSPSPSPAPFSPSPSPSATDDKTRGDDSSPFKPPKPRAVAVKRSLKRPSDEISPTSKGNAEHSSSSDKTNGVAEKLIRLSPTTTTISSSSSASSSSSLSSSSSSSSSVRPLRSMSVASPSYQQLPKPVAIKQSSPLTVIDLEKFGEEYLTKHFRSPIHIKKVPVDFSIDDLCSWVKEPIGYHNFSRFPATLEGSLRLPMILKRMANSPTAVTDFDIENHYDLKMKIKKWIRDTGFDFIAPKSKLDFLRYLSDNDSQINSVFLDIGSLKTGNALQINHLATSSLHAVVNGKKRFWIIQEESQNLSKVFDDTQARVWINPELIKCRGFNVLEIVVKAGEALWIPSGMSYMSENEATPTVSISWQILLCEHLCDSYVANLRNKAAKVQLKELLWQVALEVVSEITAKKQTRNAKKGPATPKLLSDTLLSQLLKILHRMIEEEYFEEDSDSKLRSGNFGIGEHEQYEKLQYQCSICNSSIWNRVVECSRCALEFCPRCMHRLGHLHQDSLILRERIDKDQLTGVRNAIQEKIDLIYSGFS
eukprot:TRINITY_DN534_c0_g4_i1.p1 TRINITY_DN534_c0_g4~~TRINITY_DN534_c0_g4_i1.p1  ORF type:complete len:685 (-),score=163.67 TRINITY_DN534_c0_g4_i1:87-2105(-)